MSDIVERLRKFEIGPDIDHKALCAVLLEAADEIEFLRKHAGAVSRGPSFVEIAQDTPKRTVVEGDS